MILAALAALVIQTYDGQTRVVEGLTERGCDAARCMAQYGKSCIAAAVDGVAEHRAQTARIAYEKAHPLVCPPPKPLKDGWATVQPCFREGEPRYATLTTGSSVQATPSGATEHAICVR